MLNFTYAGIPFKSIGDGYRVACMMTPNVNLIGDNFYVYLSISRKMEEDGSIKLEHIKSTVKGILALQGSGPNNTGLKHSFQDIRLLSVLFHGDHRTKSRILEFQYQQNTLAEAKKDPVDLTNEWTSTCASKRLGHRLTVGDRNDALLGLAYRQTAGGGTILRLQWYANNANSILAEICKRRGGWKKDEPLNLTLDGTTIPITKDNLSRVLVEQTWGRFSNIDSPTYEELLNANTARMNLRPSSAGDVLRRDRGDDSKDDSKVNIRGIEGGVVETATFVFQDTANSELELT